MSDLTPAQTAYAAYGATTGGLNFRGEPMPAWEQLGDKIQAAWTAATRAVLTVAADKVDETAEAMRECSGEYPEEWSSRDVRDAVRCAGSLVRLLAFPASA